MIDTPSILEFKTYQDEPVLIEVDSRLVRDLVILAAIGLQMASGGSVGLETDFSPTPVAQASFASHGASTEAYHG